MPKLRILLADDHVLIREGLKRIINAQPDMEVIGEAGDGEEACREASSRHPDIVIMDVSMPNLNGAQATAKLRATCPHIKILALSAYDDEAYLRQLFEMGAVGYVLKRAIAEELTQAVRLVASGGTYVDPAIAGKIISGYVTPPTKEVDINAISDREAQVMRLLAWGHTNKEIAVQLHISVKTVETHKARLMEKLDLSSR
ncbi:MAG TPA: response regulator transcription factor, partial [Abditibacteriaceae bacterium]